MQTKSKLGLGQQSRTVMRFRGVNGLRQKKKKTFLAMVFTRNSLPDFVNGSQNSQTSFNI